MPWFWPIGPAEDDALVGVGDGPLDGDAPDAERLGGDEDALGVEPVEQVGEAAALLADALVDRHDEVVEAHLAATPPRCGRPWGSA